MVTSYSVSIHLLDIEYFNILATTIPFSWNFSSYLPHNLFTETAIQGDSKNQVYIWYSSKLWLFFSSQLLGCHESLLLQQPPKDCQCSGEKLCESEVDIDFIAYLH